MKTGRDEVLFCWLSSILVNAILWAGAVLAILHSMKPAWIFAAAFMVAFSIGNFAFWSIALANNMPAGSRE